MRSTGARENPLPTVVGSRSRLPPPSRRRPKHSDKAGVERNHCEADPPQWGGYSYLFVPHQTKYGTRPLYVGSPAQIETHAGPVKKLRASYGLSFGEPWRFPSWGPRVHARTLSPQWSAAEAAYLHPAVAGRSTATKPEWRETTVRPSEGIGIYLSPTRQNVAQGRFTWGARHRSRPMPGQFKNCVLPMDSHSGSHEGSPHEVHGCTREPSPHSGRQPKPPTSTQLSQAEAQRQSRSGEKPLWGR